MDGLYRYGYRYIPPPDEESRVEMMGREDERRGEGERRGEEGRGRENRTKQTTIRPPQSFFFFFFLNDMPEDRRKTKDRAGKGKEEDFIYPLSPPFQNFLNYQADFFNVLEGCTMYIHTYIHTVHTYIHT